MLFSLGKTRVKLGTVLIETVLSGDYLYTNYCSHMLRLIYHSNTAKLQEEIWQKSDDYEIDPSKIKKLIE